MGRLKSDDPVTLRAELARDLGWRRWGCGGARRGAARMLEAGERPLLAALASRRRMSPSGKPRMPLTSWLLVATDRQLIVALKWPLGRLHTEQVRYAEVVAMQSDADRGEVALSTPDTTLQLCFFQPADAESALMALLAERLPRERVRAGPAERPANAVGTGAAELPSGAVGTGAAEPPLEAWRLTAPESYLLRYAEHGPRAWDAFELALKELVARRALRVEPAMIGRKWVPGARSVWLLTEGPQIGSVTAPALTPVLELFQHVQGRRSRVAVRASAPDVELEGVLLPDFVMASARRSHGFHKYLRRDVEASLARRGLLAGSGRFRRRAQHTVAGRRANEDLDRWLDEGRRCLARRGRVEDPGRAFDYLRRAGAAALLIHDAGAALGFLDAVLRTGTAEKRALYGASIGRAAYDGPDAGSDVWALDSDVTALEGLEKAFGAIDATFDAATAVG